MLLLLGFVKYKVSLAYGTHKADKMPTEEAERIYGWKSARRRPHASERLIGPQALLGSYRKPRTARRVEGPPQAETPVQDRSNVMPNGQRHGAQFGG